MANRLEVFVELVNQWNAIGNVDADDVIVRNVVQVLDQCADRVAVRCQHDALSCLDGRGNRFIPKGNYTVYRVFQAFCERDLFCR